MNVIHENIFRELINDISDISKSHPNKKIVWCGENSWAMMIFEILRICGICIDTVVDNSYAKIGIKTSLYEIYSFEYIKEHNKNCIFLLANTRGQEIVTQLVDMGIDREDIFVLRPIEYVIGKFENNFICDMYDKSRLCLKELQAILLEILIYFKKTCDDNNLRYYLYDGTLIGAARHKGFIPWDDDIDVAMPYEDYVKLSQLFVENEKYSLIRWDDCNNYEFSWMKVVDKTTRMIHPWNTVIGCYIDVFPLGGYPSDDVMIEKKWSEYMHAEKEWQAYYILRDTSVGAHDVRKDIIERLFDLPFDEAEFVGIMRKEKQKPWVAPKKWFETIELTFCGDKFKAPAGYDSYLRMKYGNYMEVPDVERREAHGFKAWRL